jgi:GNAT superfamily N-acetyltransferase
VEPILRRATPADAPAITALVRAAYGPYESLIGRTPLPMLADFGEAIRDHEVWVLDATGVVVGLLELVERPDHLWIEDVAISPDWQRRGLGRRLLGFAEDEALGRGLPELRLLTNERYLDNIAMYERYGYRETHREPHQGTDLVHFRKPLAT